MLLASASWIEQGLTAEKGEVGSRPSAGIASFSTPGRSMVVGVRGTGGQAPLKVELVDQPKHGRAQIKRASGRIRYAPQQGFVGIDSFTYRVVDVPKRAEIDLASPGSGGSRVLSAGRHTFDNAIPAPGLELTIRTALEAFAGRAAAAPSLETPRQEEEPKWHPQWISKFDGKVTHLDVDQSGRVWVVCQNESGAEIHRIDREGKVAGDIESKETILSLWAAQSPEQLRSFAVLVGSKDDDMVRAYDAKGREVWHFRPRSTPVTRWAIATKRRGSPIREASIGTAVCLRCWWAISGGPAGRRSPSDDR